MACKLCHSFLHKEWMSSESSRKTHTLTIVWGLFQCGHSPPETILELPSSRSMSLFSWPTSEKHMWDTNTYTDVHRYKLYTEIQTQMCMFTFKKYIPDTYGISAFLRKGFSTGIIIDPHVNSVKNDRHLDIIYRYLQNL